MADKISYGWTGKLVRVNLSSDTISIEDDSHLQDDYIGGMGFANKILYDEVPAGVDWKDEEAKIVLAAGPLTGSGVPLAGRSTWSHLSTFTTDHLVVDSHNGGMIGAALKYSGHDAIIIEGAADTPVYILIDDDTISIEDASDVWGRGTREAAEILCRKHGTDFCPAVIGPAGENLLPYSVIINARSHSAGAGAGACLGVKKCKGVVIRGTKAVHVADPQMVADLSDYMIDQLLGALNNHVGPATQQSWAEYYDAGSRWTARKGLYWGAAEGGPIELGECPPHNPNKVGFHTMIGPYDHGPIAKDYAVKMSGCHGCPVRCYANMHVPKAMEITGYQASGNTCATSTPYTYMMGMMEADLPEEEIYFNDVVMTNTQDDLGLWCNYGQLYRDLVHVVESGVYESHASAEELARLDWDKIRGGDVREVVNMFIMLCQNDSELAKVAHGPIVWARDWDDMGWFDDVQSKLTSYRGWPEHHANDCLAQVGAITSCMFNRDPMVHSAEDFRTCGLPQDLKRQMAKEMWGAEEALDGTLDYTPMNEAKAELTWWSTITDILHDSLVVCNWVWPMAMSPDYQRSYRGDLDLEAQFYTAVTGHETTIDDLYRGAERILTLQRAMTARGMRDQDGNMGCNDFRAMHDVLTDWVYDKDPDIEAFTPGTDKLEREDFQTALTLFYRRMGWDEKLGCPTRQCLTDLGMDDVAAELEELGLLPDSDGTPIKERTRTYAGALATYSKDNPAL